MSVDVDPSSPPFPKLPLGATIALSYSTYFQHFIDALRASWLWLAAVAAITGVASWRQWSWMGAVIAEVKPGMPPQALNHVPQPLALAALAGLDDILLTLAGISIAVAWHRLLILGEHPGFSGSNIATRDLWRYIGVGLAIGLIVMLPIVVIVFPAFYFVFSFQSAAPGSPPPAGLFLLIPLVFVLYILATAVMLRLILLLPARAAGDLSLTFRQTWNRTRGNTWRLFWGMMATTVPPIMLADIAFMVIGAGNVLTRASEDFARRMTATSTIFIVYYLLMLPIGIGFLSHAYRHFFRPESAPVVRTSEA
jgi:hypothetical protein